MVPQKRHKRTGTTVWGEPLRVLGWAAESSGGSATAKPWQFHERIAGGKSVKGKSWSGTSAAPQTSPTWPPTSCATGRASTGDHTSTKDTTTQAINHSDHYTSRSRTCRTCTGAFTTPTPCQGEEIVTKTRTTSKDQDRSRKPTTPKERQLPEHTCGRPHQQTTTKQHRNTIQPPSNYEKTLRRSPTTGSCCAWTTSTAQLTSDQNRYSTLTLPQHSDLSP